jgi:hypothetical protein
LLLFKRGRHAEKTSVGCSDDRDLTYFGEAFYRDVLPKAGDSRSTFEDAKRAIGLREQQENQVASDQYPMTGQTAASH